MSIEERLATLELELPQAPAPVANYVPAVRVGNLVYTSGQVPTQAGMLEWQGKVPTEVSPEDAYQAAKIAALNALAAVATVVPDLDHVKQIVRLTGYVQSADGFTAQPAVINGASDLLLALFGEVGKHSRAAIGVAELPLDSPVEVDLIVEVKE